MLELHPPQITSIHPINQIADAYALFLSNPESGMHAESLLPQEIQLVLPPSELITNPLQHGTQKS
jgi:hypothetical protein